MQFLFDLQIALQLEFPIALVGEFDEFDFRFFILFLCLLFPLLTLFFHFLLVGTSQQLELHTPLELIHDIPLVPLEDLLGLPFQFDLPQLKLRTFLFLEPLFDSLF